MTSLILPQVVVVIGAPKSGKTLLAHWLHTDRGYYYISLRQPVIDVLSHLLHIPPNAFVGAAKHLPHPVLFGDTPEAKVRQMRKALDSFSKECVFHYVKCTIAEVCSHSPRTRFVIDDVLSEGDLDMLKTLKSVIVEVHRAEKPALAPALAAHTDVHVDNKGTLADIHELYSDTLEKLNQHQLGALRSGVGAIHSISRPPGALLQ